MPTTEVRRPRALLLPGQGAQHPGMATELYGRDRTFTAELDEFFAGLDGGARLREEWLTVAPDSPADDASRAQPLLFAIGYGIGKSLMAHGFELSVLLGHSVGELAAAALAGVFDLADAARVLSARTAVTANAPAGGMLAVGAPAAALSRFLDRPDDPAGVVVGARNAPRQTVLAGPRPRLDEVRARLADAGITCRPVKARQPFHSPALGPAAARFAAEFGRITLRPPAIPIVSTRTAALVTDAEAIDPWFWAGQLARPVLFWPALDTLLAGGPYTLVDASPGQALSSVAHLHPAVRDGGTVVVSLLSRKGPGTADNWNAALDRLTTL